MRIEISARLDWRVQPLVLGPEHPCSAAAVTAQSPSGMLLAEPLNISSTRAAWGAVASYISPVLPYPLGPQWHVLRGRSAPQSVHTWVCLCVYGHTCVSTHHRYTRNHLPHLLCKESRGYWSGALASCLVLGIPRTLLGWAAAPQDVW